MLVGFGCGPRRRCRGRPPRPDPHVTARDRWIVAAVHEHRVLTTPQLTALAFTGLRSAQRRLTALTRTRVLDRFQPAVLTGSAPAHYALGPAGAVLLSTPDRPIHRIGSPSPLTLQHTLGVNDLYVALATPTTEHGAGGWLERWWGERTCRAWWGHHARPDAYGRWHGPDTADRPQRVDFFLEYDTGTENLPRVVAKLVGYRRLAAATGITTPILFVLPSAVRESNLQARLAGQALQHTPVATTHSHAMDALPHPGGPAWLPVGTTTRIPLGALPHPQHTGPGTEQAGQLEVRGWTPPPPRPPTAPSPPAAAR
ncbi:MAG: replication-relaxation family protein [Angustibacter sp.]